MRTDKALNRLYSFPHGWRISSAIWAWPGRARSMRTRCCACPASVSARAAWRRVLIASCGVRRQHRLRGRRAWAHRARARRHPEQAGQGRRPHHRSRSAGIAPSAIERPAPRLRGRARCADRRRAGHGLDADLRSERHRLQRQSPSLGGDCQGARRPAQLPRHSRALSAGLDFQGGDGACRPHRRRHQARGAHRLPRRHASAIISSIAGRPRHGPSRCTKPSVTLATSISTRRSTASASTGWR